MSVNIEALLWYVIKCYSHYQVVFMYKREKISLSNLLGNCGQFMKKHSKEIALREILF